MSEQNLANVECEEIDYLVHKITRDQRGRSKVWAAQMGISQQVLLNKTNQNLVDTHLSPTELLSLMMLSGDFRVLREFKSQINRSETNIDSLMTAVMKADKEHGDFCKYFLNADEDGVISPAEEKRCLDELREEIMAIENTIKSFKQYAKTSRESRRDPA